MKNQRTWRDRFQSAPFVYPAGLKKMRPFILTCDHENRLPTFELFVKSYLDISQYLLPPIIFAGFHEKNTSSRYLHLLDKLKPHKIIKQPDYFSDPLLLQQAYKKLPKKKWRTKPYVNTQQVVIQDFPRLALEFSQPTEDILWIEDDILFSQHFPSALSQTVQHFQQDFCDFITLHTNTAWGLHKNKRKGVYLQKPGLPADSFIYPIDGKYFFCTQCVAFNRRTVELLNKDWQGVDQITPRRTGWDLKWGHYIEAKGYKMYTSRKSYVQTQAGYSGLEPTHYRKVKSSNFIP